MSPLQKAIQIISNGNQSDFARKVSEINCDSLSQRLVWHWVKNKKPPSPRFVVSISMLTEHEITPNQLSPGVFPPHAANDPGNSPDAA